MPQTYETRNAKITSTMLGIEDHGILTCYLNLDYGRSSQGFGGYSLDDCPKDRGDQRVGTVFGIQFLLELFRTLEVSEWEKLPGNYCRVQSTQSKIHAIGHPLKDQWFCPADLADKLRISQ